MERSELATHIISPTPLKRSKYSLYGEAVFLLILVVIALTVEFQLIEIDPNTQYVPGLSTGDNPLFVYPDIEESVSTTGLVMLCILPWFLLFALSTLWLYVVTKDFPLQQWLLSFSLWFRMVLFAFSVVIIVVDAIKLSVGSPRPYFITAYSEHGASSEEVFEARLSFPSGHSASPMCTLLLLSMLLLRSWQFTQSMHYQQAAGVGMMGWDNPHSFYLSQLWWWLRDAPLVGILLVFSPVCLALYSGCSRITDYKHFAADVIAGFLVGAAVAYISYLAFYNEMYMEFEHRVRLALSPASKASPSADSPQAQRQQISNTSAAMDMVEQTSEMEDHV